MKLAHVEIRVIFCACVKCNVSRSGKFNLLDTTTSSCLSVVHNINVLFFVSDSCSVIFPFLMSFLDCIEVYIHYTDHYNIGCRRSIQYT